MQIVFIIQKVQDTVIHVELDEEEQWEITQGSKRQAERTEATLKREQRGT